VAGTSGKVRLEGDDDAEGASTEQQGAAIREALGTETRNKVRCSQQAAQLDYVYSEEWNGPETRLLGSVGGPAA